MNHASSSTSPATDALAQAKARRYLRNLRRADLEGFDQLWDDARGDLSAWLRHLDHDQLTDEQMRRWINSPSLEEEEAFLASNTDLVSEEAEAVLDHLIDANPGNRWLHMHRDIIRAARTTSADDREETPRRPGRRTHAARTAWKLPFRSRPTQPRYSGRQVSAP